MTEWVIRAAAEEDSAAVSLCLDAAYAAHRARLPDLPDVAAGVPDAIAADRVRVAEFKDLVVGVLMLSAGEGWLKLENVAVHPDASGKGLGRALLARAEAEAVEQGINQLRLTTHAAIPENVSLYEHLGWRVMAREGNKVRMAKAL